MTDETPRTALDYLFGILHSEHDAELAEAMKAARKYVGTLPVAAAAPSEPPRPSHCPNCGADMAVEAAELAVPPEPPRPDLRQWVRHPLTCDAAYDRPGLHECSCGLSEALAGLAAPQGQPLDVETQHSLERIAAWSRWYKEEARTQLRGTMRLIREEAVTALARLTESGSPTPVCICHVYNGQRADVLGCPVHGAPAPPAFIEGTMGDWDDPETEGWPVAPPGEEPR